MNQIKTGKISFSHPGMLNMTFPCTTTLGATDPARYLSLECDLLGGFFRGYGGGGTSLAENYFAKKNHTRNGGCLPLNRKSAKLFRKTNSERAKNDVFV